MQRKTLILLTFLFSRIPGAQIAQTLFYFVLGGLLIARPLMGYRLLGAFFGIEVLALIALLLNLAWSFPGKRRKWLFTSAGILTAAAIAFAMFADGSRAAVIGLGILAVTAGIGRIYAAYSQHNSLLERFFCAVEGAAGFLMAGLLLLRGGTFPEAAPWCGVFFCALTVLIGSAAPWRNFKHAARKRRQPRS